MVHFTLKNFLAAAALTLAGTAIAADNAPTFDWADYLQSSGGTMIKSVALGADGASYWMGNATSDADAVKLNNEDIFTGEAKIGNTANYNFVLFKAAADGTPQWNIHSTNGDFASGKFAGVVEYGDNIYFAVGVRQYSADVKNNLVDAKGTKFEFGDVVSNTADRYFMAVLVCASKDGEISWIKPFNGPAGEKDVFTTQGLAVGADGTLVMGLQASKPVTYGTTTITPTANNQNFVVLFDKDGNYNSHFATEGATIPATSISTLSCEGSDFYFGATATATGEAVTFSFGGKEITTGTKVSAFVAKASLASLKEGKFDWATSLPTDPMEGKTGSAFVDVRLTPGVNCHWVTATFSGVITMGDKTVSAVQTAQNEGLLIKLDADGAFVEGTTSRVGFPDANYITAYEGVLQAEADKAYVYGYGMNVAAGQFLREYNAETLAPVADADWTLVTFAGMPTGNVFAYDKKEGTLYIFTRPNKPVTVLGEVQPQEISNYQSFCGKYTLPKNLQTGLESVGIEADAPVRYFNLQGVEVAHPANGIFIEVKGNKATKVAL